jgi:hypothetical protein
MVSEYEEYYAENIEIPHPQRPTLETESEKLAAIIRNEGFGEQLAAIKDPFERQENALAAAHVIGSQVREALWYVEPRDFKRFDIQDDVVSLDHLRGKQAARCIGFAVVASECLEMSGIDHWVGFANGHSTILLPTEGGARLHLADPLTAVLSQDLEHSMVTAGYSDRSIADDMEEFGRSAIELNTLSMATRARDNTVELLRDHPWLMFTRGDGEYGRQQLAQDMVVGQDPYGKPVHPSRARIFMSLFLPEDGRQLLHDYDALRTAYSRGELVDAAGILYDRIADAYPDLDARQSHRWVKDIVRKLSTEGNANYARKLLERYFESFVLMADDSRVPEAHADCLRIVAREAGDPDAAREAAAIYEKVLGYDRAYKGAVSKKLAKTTVLAEGLEAQPSPAS